MDAARAEADTVKHQSWLRDKKRRMMHRNKTTFTDRLKEAIRTKTEIKSISFRLEKPPVLFK